jgi:hypothetical protein
LHESIDQQPHDEATRLAAVERCAVVDLDFDERYAGVLRIASRVFDVPFAMITVVTEHDL